jgi:hypothetical protein
MRKKRKQERKVWKEVHKKSIPSLEELAQRAFGINDILGGR